MRMHNNYIINPKTNRKVRVDTRLGKSILLNYDMNGGKHLRDLFGFRQKAHSSPQQPEPIDLSSSMGKALIKDLKKNNIRVNQVKRSSTFEDLVQLLANKGVKDRAKNSVTPESWLKDWNDKKDKEKQEFEKKR